jgi:hypothetical protein
METIVGGASGDHANIVDQQRDVRKSYFAGKPGYAAFAARLMILEQFDYVIRRRDVGDLGFSTRDADNAREHRPWWSMRFTHRQTEALAKESRSFTDICHGEPSM